jgi:hypothetical protein
MQMVAARGLPVLLAVVEGTETGSLWIGRHEVVDVAEGPFAVPAES